jgi:hypothetical protein
MRFHSPMVLPLFTITLLVCALLAKGVIWLSALPAPLFREFVLKPVPKSVTQLEFDQARGILGYGYVFHFRISQEDVALLLRSRPFRPVANVSYEGGSLGFHYDDGSQHGVLVYPPDGKKAPAWYVPWRQPDLRAYACHEQKGAREYTWALLYDEKSTEAYFLAFAVK